MTTATHPLEATRRQRRELIDQILASERFRRSKRMSDFLRYVGEAELGGRVDQINEQQIGQWVYGKPPGYNAAEENVVRVDARRLRAALKAYFNEENRDCEWILEIPRGCYVPAYRRREASSSERFVSSTAKVAPQGPHLLERADGGGQWKLRGVLLLFGAIVGLAAGVLIDRERSVGAEQPAMQPDRLLAAFSAEDRDTLVVVADSQWSAIQSVTGLRLSLSDYLDPEFRLGDRIGPDSRPLEQHLEFLRSRQFVPLSNIHFLKKLIQVQGPLSSRTTVKFARNLRLRDMQDANVIFLGSRSSIPWVELFEDKLHFLLKEGRVENRKPGPGEEKAYFARQGEGERAEVYAHIAAVPNLSGAGQVLIVEGTGLEGTESAANFVMDSVRNREFVEQAQIADNLLHFELLLRSHNLDGAPSAVEVVAFRPSSYEQ